MATIIEYLRGGEAITPTEMNALFGSFSGRMETILGGRSFLPAFKNTGFSTQDHGQSSYHSFPYQIVGKCFHFLDGATYYANFTPGFKAKTVTVYDPIAAANVSAQGGYSYDETAFDSPTITPISYDRTNRICTIADIPEAQYPAWLFKLNGVSIFEHSLRTHTRELQGPEDDEPKTYWLKEQSAPIPSKYYHRALAEIIIEGPIRVSLPETLDKFKCFRFHNLQPRDCVVELGGTTFTLQPFECCCWRRDSDYLGHGKELPEDKPKFKNYRRSAFRYFFEFEDNDPRDFWFHPRLPDGTNYFRTFTSASGMQGNNLCNPAMVHDWIRLLTDRNNYAHFERDPHAHICDLFNLVPEYREKFGKRGATETTIQDEWCLGDLLHHRGALTIARKTGSETVLESGEFIGYQPLVEFLSSLIGMQINGATDASGNLTLEDNSGADRVDIIQHGTNFLKGFAEAGDWPQEWVIQTGRNIDSPFTIESKVMEANPVTANTQDINGGSAFTLKATSGYRIAQRIINASARSASYVDFNGVTQVINGNPLETIAEVLGTQATINGIHNVTVADLKTLKYFGNGALSTQNDSRIEFTDAALTLTPEGLVLTFKEKVSAATIPNLTETSWYVNQFGNRLDYDASAGKWLLKHCVRFRGHGWGYGQHGRNYSAFYGPIDGRCRVRGYSGDVSGPFGADEVVVRQFSARTGAELLRRIDVSEIGVNVAGERFLTTPRPAIDPPWIRIDALPEFLASKSGATFEAMRTKLIPYSNQSLTRTATMSMPLSVAHYNAMAQAVNQLTEGRALDYRAFRFIVGPKVLAFESLPGYAMNGPSPADCFSRTDNIGGGLREYWEYFFEKHDVQIKTTAQFPPSFHAFKTAAPQGRAVKLDVTAKVQNCTYGSNKKVIESGGSTYWWYRVNGQINATISNVRMSDARAFSGDGVVFNWRAQTPALNLNSAYAGVSWVSVSEVRAMIESLQLPFVYADAFYPLKLVSVGAQNGELENFASLTSLNRVFAGEIYSFPSSYLATQEVLTPGDQAELDAWNNSPAHNSTITIPFGFDQSTLPTPAFFTSAGAFLLAKTTAEVEWKIAFTGTTPPECLNLTNSTERHPSLRWHKHINVTTAGGPRRVNIGYDGILESLRKQSPWHPENFSQVFPVGIGEGSGPGSTTPFNGSAFSARYVRSEGPRAFIEVKGESESLSNYIEILEARNSWLAFRVENTNGGKLKVFSITQPAFGKIFNWWVGKDSAYLSSLAGTHTAVPLDLYQPEHSQIECSGTTLLKPAENSNVRLLFELDRALVPL